VFYVFRYWSLFRVGIVMLVAKYYLSNSSKIIKIFERSHCAQTCIIISTFVRFLKNRVLYIYVQYVIPLTIY